MRLPLIAIMLLPLAAGSRPIEVPSYEELQMRADVVLILKVLNITETDAKTGQYGDPNFYQGYRAECQVLSVLKGNPEEKVVSIPFFQHPVLMPGFNGAIVAPFSLDERPLYLAFLKKDEKKQMTPLTGEYDAGLSIKMMFDRVPDFPKYLKLPPHTAKPTGSSTNSIPSPK